MPDKKPFTFINPSPALAEFVHSYWETANQTDEPCQFTIFPDSFFKVIFYLAKGKITAYFLTGLWPKETEITIPPRAKVYGVKFKILAPEYIFNHEMASLLQTHRELNLDFWNLNSFDFSSFEKIVEQIEVVLLEKLKSSNEVTGNKLQLSQLLYKTNGDLSAEEVSNQIAWSNRQINRYLNKYLGVSLKAYLNIQKVFASYIQIREGRFFPDQGYHDQAHFIKTIKKHTGQTPKGLFNEKDDRFIQLKHFRKK